MLILLFNNNLIFVKDFFRSSINAKNEIERLGLENDSLKTELYISENLSGKDIKEGKNISKGFSNVRDAVAYLKS